MDFLVFENVLGLRDRRHRVRYSRLINGIKRLGFQVVELELSAADFGVPQSRRRIFVVGVADGIRGTSLDVVSSTTTRTTVRDAIGGLPDPAYFRRDLNPRSIPHHRNHWTMVPRSTRFRTPPSKWRESRSFKLLSWDEVSPTLAFGNREIHVHPSGRRRLSIFEALLLQGFPEEFELAGTLSEQVTQVSNAVAPPVALAIALALRARMTELPR